MYIDKPKTLNIYLTGGFLGSGKTTAIVNACKNLSNQGRRVAVITNDQGDQQVDSGYMQSLSILNAEVANGCFCCNYEALEKNIFQLSRSHHPEIIFAESVGSCTDLAATIAKPFTLFHPDIRVVISVFADASLLYSIISGTSLFIEESVQYIYKKQLEEADLIVINKTDLLPGDELTEVKHVVESTYPGKFIHYQDSFNEQDIDTWLGLLTKLAVPSLRRSLALDYAVYGAGEAALAWLDKMIAVHTMLPVAVEVALKLTGHIHEKIKLAGYTIGHLKFLLSDGEGWTRKISFTTSGYNNDFTANDYKCKQVSVLINARVQAPPQFLQEIVASAIHETMMATKCRIVSGKENSFQPGYPKPLHRMGD